MVRQIPPRTGQRYPRSFYDEVAQVWLAAWAKRGGHPTTTVAAEWGVAYSVAAAWVKRARQYGALTQRFKRVHVCPGCGHRIECSSGDA